MIKRSLFQEPPDYYVGDLHFEEVELVEVIHKESRELYVSTLNTGYGVDQMRMVDVGVLLSNYSNPPTYGEDPEDHSDSVFEVENDTESEMIERRLPPA